MCAALSDVGIIVAQRDDKCTERWYTHLRGPETMVSSQNVRAKAEQRREKRAAARRSGRTVCDRQALRRRNAKVALGADKQTRKAHPAVASFRDKQSADDRLIYNAMQNARKLTWEAIKPAHRAELAKHRPKMSPNQIALVMADGVKIAVADDLVEERQGRRDASFGKICIWARSAQSRRENARLAKFVATPRGRVVLPNEQKHARDAANAATEPSAPPGMKKASKVSTPGTPQKAAPKKNGVARKR